MIKWRKIFWAYQSAAGGYCIVIFGRFFHVSVIV